MLNLGNTVSNKNTSSSEDNNWPFRLLIIGPSGSSKTNTLLHLINNLHPMIKFIYILKIYTNQSMNIQLIKENKQE